jgi:hypothetical protein
MYISVSERLFSGKEDWSEQEATFPNVIPALPYPVAIDFSYFIPSLRDELFQNLFVPILHIAYIACIKLLSR